MNNQSKKRGQEMQRAIMHRIPGYPVFPFVFPLGMLLALLALTTWFSYLSWKELDAIRKLEEAD
jgi:hypothetical protein